MRGLYRYQSGKDRWWACAEDKGERVHIERKRYEAMSIQPPFNELPVESDDSDKTKRRA